MRKTDRRKIVILLAIAVVAAVIAVSFWDAKRFLQTVKVPVKEEAISVKRVIDGDTIELASGERVRYIGINTPETVDARKEIECFGKEASEENKKLVEGKKIRLEKDISDKDKYGRLLRYVFIGDIFVNEDLVRNGFARVSTFPPDVKFAKQFLTAEREARENKRGLWRACFSSPDSL